VSSLDVAKDGLPSEARSRFRRAKDGTGTGVFGWLEQSVVTFSGVAA
jgi:hypothetical protein